jgi:hypothetical protein
VDRQYSCQQCFQAGALGHGVVFLLDPGGCACGSKKTYEHWLASYGTHAAIRLNKILGAKAGVVHAVGPGLGPHCVLPSFRELAIRGSLPHERDKIDFLAGEEATHDLSVCSDPGAAAIAAEGFCH